MPVHETLPLVEQRAVHRGRVIVGGERQQHEVGARRQAVAGVVEKIRQFAFADEPFTIENEEMTPSMKIRRHKIRERYGPRLDALYRH